MAGRKPEETEVRYPNIEFGQGVARRYLVCFVILLAVLSRCSLSFSQQALPPTYGIGVDAVTGMKSSCPVFIGRVFQDSPAAKAGLRAGDRLVALDGHVVADFQDAVHRLSSNESKPVVLEFARDEKIRELAVQREDKEALLAKDGWKIVDGNLVRVGATDADIRYQLATERQLEGSNGTLAVAFTDQHYPADKQLYYPGFEVFIWESGRHLTVGGIEQGPASRSGLRWGDEVVSINGADPHGSSAARIESMLSSPKPASVTLTVARGAVPWTVSFALERASEVLTENQKKVMNGKIVPLWLPEKYLACWQ
jgi:S1-C subfamily serine protease